MEGARTESAPEQETGKRSPDAALSGVRVQLEKKEYIALRMAAGYWKACHKDAVRREAELKSENEQLRARLRDLEQRLFGRRSERGAAGKGRGSQAGLRPRGHQRGRPGHGRSRLAGLEVREETADLSEDQRACPRCGRLAVPFAGSEDVEIAEIETQLWRRLIRRKRYHAACGCGALPGIVTAPSPARLIPRGKLGISVWVKVILDKYPDLRPSNRLLQELACHGLKLSPGTVAGGLQRLLPLFEPVREALRRRQLSEERWQADETGWRVFERVEGKVGWGWHLWVFRCRSAVVFTLSPSRSAQVPEAHFGSDPGGILLCDRYAAYKKLAGQWEGLQLAYCWAHVRRDFLDLARAWPEQEEWALDWTARIGTLYELNRLRLQAIGQPRALARRERHVRDCLDSLARQREYELRSPDLHPAAGKVLQSLQRHLRGLSLFADHPEVAMDNNAAERALRGPVVGRKGFYGSGSVKSARLAAALFSILHTLQLHRIDPHKWLSSYLQACAQAGNRPPPQLERFLPWGMDPARREDWREAA